jgi:hypothetical protein
VWRQPLSTLTLEELRTYAELVGHAVYLEGENEESLFYKQELIQHQALKPPLPTPDWYWGLDGPHGRVGERPYSVRAGRTSYGLARDGPSFDNHRVTHRQSQEEIVVDFDRFVKVSALVLGVVFVGLLGRVVWHLETMHQILAVGPKNYPAVYESKTGQMMIYVGKQRGGWVPIEESFWRLARGVNHESSSWDGWLAVVGALKNWGKISEA